MIQRTRRFVIFATTIGSILEWYEFSLYVYLAPIIALLFFPKKSGLYDLDNTFLVFAIGFLSRPVGALLFGYLGDRYGRKTSLISSVVLITIPTFFIGFLPTYAQIGLLAPLLLCFMRLLQGFPAGGEMTGSFCYLVESAPFNQRNYVGSWAFVGSQVGGIISIIECLLLDRYLSREALIGGGWRYSFMLGALIGLLGCFLRYKLKETPIFLTLEKHHKITKTPILQSFRNYKKQMLMGVLLSVLPLAGYYMVFVLTSIYFEKILNLSFAKNLILNGLFLALSTVCLPVFGRLGDKYRSRPLLIWSAIGVILLSYPLYATTNIAHLPWMLFLNAIVILFLTIHFALLPMVLSELFPTPVRYTCVALSYNISNGIFGGTAPLIAIFLIKHTKNTTTPCIILIATALITLITLFGMKEKKPEALEKILS